MLQNLKGYHDKRYSYIIKYWKYLPYGIFNNGDNAHMLDSKLEILFQKIGKVLNVLGYYIKPNFVD